MSSLTISSEFDSGNIRCVEADKAQNIKLEIVADNNSDFYQWFYFRLTGAKNSECIINIMNAGNSAYPKGWEDYQAVASDDREKWSRIPTKYNDGVLTFKYCPKQNSAWFAYFAPYTLERHNDYLARIQSSSKVLVSVLGKTIDGHDIDFIQIGELTSDKHKIWVVALQHPGESMAEWWTEGFINRLIETDDLMVQNLLEKSVFFIVPNMNPDGTKRGHLRTNAVGVNLNREWSNTSLKSSPEIFLVRKKMHEIGVDFCLDVHGDEALPYNFLSGMMGIPSLSEHQKILKTKYDKALLNISTEFQTEFGYPPSAPGKGNLNMCSNYVAETFSCLSLTLEMPFKDNINNPDAEFGWSLERSREFGASNLEAVAQIVDELR